MAALNGASSVFAKMDYTHSFMDGPNSFMIPMPDPSNSVGAIIKPFQLWVSSLRVFAHRTPIAPSNYQVS